MGRDGEERSIDMVNMDRCVDLKEQDKFPSINEMTRQKKGGKKGKITRRKEEKENARECDVTGNETKTNAEMKKQRNQNKKKTVKAATKVK